MNGYTDGIATAVSQQSLNGGLFYRNITLFEITQAKVREVLEDWNQYPEDDEIADLLNESKMDDLKQTHIDMDGSYITLDWELDELSVDLDVMTWINDNSEGYLRYIVDNDRETVLGGQLGMAGEHIGMVNVYMDTQRGTVTGGEGTFEISNSDCDTINDALKELYNC